MNPFDSLFVVRLSLVMAAFGSCIAAVATDFPEPHNSEPVEQGEPSAPEEAVKMIGLPDGFRATVFAAEPAVRNPIAMAWDWRGRMWVAENYTYAERATRFDLSLRDRILVFTDEDWDGVADQRAVFADDLQFLTSVEVGEGGVWAMCPPQLLFLPDRDGNGKVDGPADVALDGFTVAESNYHNFANGLRWGPDGWLYGRCGHSCPGRVGVPGTPESGRIPIEGGIWRFHPETRVFEVLTHGTTNPWGHDWDRHGELFFINTVNGHLWHGIPGAHFKESFGSDPHPFVYERLDTHADHWHFDTSGRWQDSRGGAADDFGGGHAHSGMMICQGDWWPGSLRDRLLTINMHGRRVNVECLEREGAGYVARHEPDIFVTEDEWFRGLDIRQGPDGSLYVLDWSDAGECHEHTGVHRTSGRIYRLRHGPDAAPDFTSLETLSAEGVRTLLADSNPWFERQLRRRLVGGGDRAVLGPVLRETVFSGGETVVRLRAMWALHGWGEPRETWRALLDDEDEFVRCWAIRFLVDSHPIDTIVGPRSGSMPEPLDDSLLEQFVALAGADPSGPVRLTLASSLQRLPLEQRARLGRALASRSEDAGDHNLPAMVWWGVSPLVESDPMAVVSIVEACRWPDTIRWAARALTGLIEENPKPLGELLAVAAREGAPLREAVLTGMSEAVRGWRKAPAPPGWDSFAGAPFVTENERVGALVRDLGVVFGDGRALDEIRDVALDREADHAMRKAALETLIANRPEDLRAVCERLLDDRVLNGVAVRGLAGFDDPALGVAIARKYRRFPSGERASIVEILVSRPAWARALLDEIEAGRVPRDGLGAFHARQIRALGDEELDARLGEVWGEIRESDDSKRELVAEWKERLSDDYLAQADLARGRQLYATICAACHRLYGEGGETGPDLTGSNRNDLDYLLENIFDPGAVVSADYRMSIIELKDGRTVTGVVADETDRTLVLRQAEAEITVEKEEVASRMTSPLSMMPEGLLLAFDEGQVRDLIAYLRHPVQVALPSEN